MKKHFERLVKMLTKILVFVLVLVLTFTAAFVNKPVICAHATDTTDVQTQYDYSNIQDKLGDSGVDFEELVGDLSENDDSSIFQKIINQIVSAVKNMYGECFASMASLFAIAALMAVFKSFASTFRNGQVCETAFYAAYALVFSAVGVCMGAASKVAYDVISEILDFMKVLLPTYAMTISFSTGTASSAAMYGGLMLAVTLADAVLLKIILPLVNMYVLTILCNQLTGGNTLSKLSSMLEGITLWLQKTLVAVVLGISALRGILAPSIDSIKRSSVMKAASAVPGVGGILSGIAETVLGAGKIIKNAVGIAGVVAIIVICLIPLVKLALYFAAFRLGSVIIQPVSDKRITETFSQSASAVMMLIKTVMAAILMFILAIAIAASATS